MRQPLLRTASFTIAAALGLFCGCTSVTNTHPERTGIEQLLLSTATDNALSGIEIPQVRGERVFVDDQYLESYDRGYVIASVRALLSENGALLQTSIETADIIVEPRSGALGMDVSESLFGLPSLPIPIPGTSTMETPELALYSAQKEDAVSKIALLGYRKDGSNVFSTEPLVGESHFHQYNFLFLVNLNFTDIPAREKF